MKKLLALVLVVTVLLSTSLVVFAGDDVDPIGPIKNVIVNPIK